MQVGRCFFSHQKRRVFEGEGVKIRAEDIYVFFFKAGGSTNCQVVSLKSTTCLWLSKDDFLIISVFLGFPQLSSHQGLLFTFVFECEHF